MEKKIFTEIARRNPRRFKPGAIAKHLGIDGAIWLAIAALKYFGGDGFLSSVLAAALFAIFSFRAFGMMHECVHSAGSSDAKVNGRVGFFAGVFCFLPFAGWRDMHVEHHRWTGNIDKDPTQKILLAFERAGFRMPKVPSFAWTYWLPLLGFMQHLVFWKATVTKGEYRFVSLSAAYLALLAWLMGPLTLVGGLIMYLYVVEMINLPHHLGMGQYHGEKRFAYFEQNQFTRSCVYPKWIAHNLLLNFNLHTAHHLFPAHPWYQLDQLHEEIVAAGLQLNMCEGNDWILKNRTRALDEVLVESFKERPTDQRAA